MRIYRLFLALLSLTSLLLPVAVNALGLGGVKLYSALNQRLDAEIEILSASAADISSTRVSLASYETFARVGLERPAVLMHLRFTVESRDGKDIVRITSRKPIQDPFLDFIIELQWPSGKIVREYTLLLDPPERQKSSPQRISSPTTESSESAPVAERSRSLPITASTQSDKSGRSDQIMQEYGPIKAGDTLWEIAIRMRKDPNISPHQIMKVLHAENPDAFIDGDINRLIKGKVLRISNPDAVRNLDRESTHREVMQKILRDDVNAQRDQLAKAAKKRPDSGSLPDIGGLGQATAAKPKLKLVSPTDAEKEETKGDTTIAGAGSKAESEARGKLRKELLLALEVSESQRRENEELKQRMVELQQQMEALQRLIALKDSDLAQIQQQFGGTEEKEKESVVSPIAQDTSKSIANPQPDVESVTVTTADAPIIESSESVADAEPVVSEISPQAETPPESVSNGTEFQQIMLMVQREPLFLIAGGSVLILLLAMLILVIKKRRNRLEESFLKGDSFSAAAQSDGPATSYLSDLAVSGIGGVTLESEEGEANPLEEADVYLAYGRTGPAEDLLQSALEREPDNLQYIGKLLEVFHAAKDKGKFEALFDLHAVALQSEPSVWKQVQRMGHDTSPENPLFTLQSDAGSDLESSTTASSGDRAKGSTLDETVDIGIDLSDLDDLTAEMESAKEDMGVDMELDFSDIDDTLFGDAMGNIGDNEFKTDLEDFLADLTKGVKSLDDDVTSLDETDDISFGSLDLGDNDLLMDIGDGTESPSAEVVVDSSDFNEVDESSFEDLGLDFDLDGLQEETGDLIVNFEDGEEEKESDSLEEGMVLESDSDEGPELQLDSAFMESEPDSVENLIELTEPTESADSILTDEFEIDSNEDGIDLLDIDGLDAEDINLGEIDNDMLDIDFSESDDAGALEIVLPKDDIDKLASTDDDINFDLEFNFDEFSLDETSPNETTDEIHDQLKEELPKQDSPVGSIEPLEQLSDDLNLTDLDDFSAEDLLLESDDDVDNLLDSLIDVPVSQADGDDLNELSLDSLEISEGDDDFFNVDSLIDDLGENDNLDLSFEGLDDLDEDLDDSNDMDTKLNLAKAYIDMGERETADGMLQEVINSGNSEQKQQAESLLSGLK